MPRNGAGTFIRTNGVNTGSTTWELDAAAAIDILSLNHDTHDQDIAGALTASIASDGQTPITANLPMSGFKHTGVGDATQANQYASFKQVQTGTPAYCGTSSGAADVFNISPTVPVTALSDGMSFRFKAHQYNAGAADATTSISSLSAIPIRFGNPTTKLTKYQLKTGNIYTVVINSNIAILQPDSSLQAVHLNVKDFGAVGDGVTDDSGAIQNAINAGAAVFFPPGQYLCNANLTCAHAVLLEGAQPPGSVITPYDSVLIHNLSGNFITFTGTDGSTYGAGGGIRNLMITNAVAAAAGGYAIDLSFTSTAIRAIWLRIQNVNVEVTVGAGQWTGSLRGNGFAAGTSDDLRDIWIENCRFTNDTGASNSIRLTKCTNINIVNCLCNLAVGDIIITGDGTTSSANVNIVGGSSNSIQLDYADATSVLGHTTATISDTANTTNTVIRASRVTNYSKLQGSGFIEYLKATDGNLIRQSVTGTNLYSRDQNAGDSTFSSLLGIGNFGANQGYLLMEYLNAAAAGSPVGRIRMLPRNNANAALYAGSDAGLVMTKTAAADTIKTELKSTNGTFTVNADGTSSFSSTQIDLGGVGSGRFLMVGTNTPEGAVTALVGSLYLRTNGGAGTSLYVKESGSGNTGWIGK